MSKPLTGVRILDFTWLGAGAKGPRHLAAYGAEVIRIEWKGKLDFMRYGPPFYRLKGEPEPPTSGGWDLKRAPSLNRAASFQNVNAGKLGISLNLHDPRGKDLFRRLVPTADVVTDNFTATTLEDWGLGYKDLCKLRPDIIRVQSPGFGRLGPKHEYRSYGPIAAAVSGLTHMSGLPDRPPSGWGFSYLDVVAPWYISMAVIAALNVRKRTGKGQYIDLSQVGPGFLHSGTAILDFAAHGRIYERSGNRAQHPRVAPHNTYRCKGYDRWIAITCETEAQWRALKEVMGHPAWAEDPAYATAEGRFAAQDTLDPQIEAWTRTQERYELMAQLQEAGVPAGVCQDTRDRYERDPQLRERGFYAEVDHSEVGRHEVEGVPAQWSRTQPHPEGPHLRGAPCYGEDNRRIFRDLLGLSDREVDKLAAENII
jgi:crotonobetainyl-CoA:carnitine CoA-transferase CaiB-like acyl-CoA transferase